MLNVSKLSHFQSVNYQYSCSSGINRQYHGGCAYLQYRHYGDVIMGGIASQIISLTIVYSTVYSGADQRKHQSSASLALVRGIHRGPVNSPHKRPVTRKMFPFDDVMDPKTFGSKRPSQYKYVISPVWGFTSLRSCDHHIPIMVIPLPERTDLIFKEARCYIWLSHLCFDLSHGSCCRYQSRPHTWR